MNIIAAANPLADLPDAGFTPDAWLALVLTILAILAVFSCIVVGFNTGDHVGAAATACVPAMALCAIAINGTVIGSESARYKEVSGVIADVNDKAISPKGVVGKAYTVDGYDFPITIRKKELSEGTWVRLDCTPRDGVARCIVKDSRYPAENP